MVSTISPVVYRSSKFDWRLLAGLYSLGSIVGGSMVGILLGTLGATMSALMHPPISSTVLLVGVLALVYSLHEMQLTSLPYPQRRHQVPSQWRNQYHPYLTAALYGALLGAALITFIPTATCYVLVAAVTLRGSPIIGVFAFASYAAARACFLWLANYRSTTLEEVEMVARFLFRTKPLVREISGIVLAATGGYFISLFIWGF